MQVREYLTALREHGPVVNTAVAITLVDELWMKEDSCNRCGKNSCYLSFIIHPNNLNSC